MRNILTVSVLAVGLLAGCSSPSEDAAKAQKSAYEAQEEVARQRLKLVEQYQDCIKDAKGDKSKEEACQSFLNAAEALK